MDVDSSDPRCFLSALPAEAAESDVVADRLELAYSADYAEFLTAEKVYTHQYSHIYHRRLTQLRDAAVEAARRELATSGGRLEVAEKVIDVKPGERRVVVGTLYKEMALKPNILDEFSEEGTGEPPQPRDNYTADSDTLILEDESGRAGLVGEALNLHELATGVVMAVCGEIEHGGELRVHNLVPLGMPPQPTPFSPSAQPAQVLLLSGLHCGGDLDPQLAALLVDLVGGHAGSEREQAESARIARVIVAGNCVQPARAAAGDKLTAKEQAALAAPVRELDMLLAELAAAVHVDVMPGPLDPSNLSLPQQPLHPCLLPHAAKFSSTRGVPNPYRCSIGGVTFLGHSGQPVEDVAKYTRGLSRLQILRSTLQWRHLAPTAPDTLACYPFVDTDPFVIKEAPHVMFAGNQPEFATELLQGPDGQTTRLVCLPEFAKSGQAVLLDLQSLECELLQLSGVSDAVRE